MKDRYRTNLMLVDSKAFAASSCVSNWTNAKFRLMRTFKILPYGSKCLSISRILVLIGSKFITNNVLVGLLFATDLEPSRNRGPRSACYKKGKSQVCIKKGNLNYLVTCKPQIAKLWMKLTDKKFKIWLIMYLRPLNRKSPSAVSKWPIVQSMDSIFSITFIFKINESKSCKKNISELYITMWKWWYFHNKRPPK